MLRNKFQIFKLFRNFQVLESVTYELNEVGVQSCGQRYRSMADDEGVAASSKGAALP